LELKLALREMREMTDLTRAQKGGISNRGFLDYGISFWDLVVSHNG